MSPGLLQHISLYKDALQVGITVISVCTGNKRIYKSITMIYKLLYIMCKRIMNLGDISQ